MGLTPVNGSAGIDEPERPPMVREPKLLECPGCGSAHIRRSKTRGIEGWLSLIGIRPYRCFNCGTRFRSAAVPTPFDGTALPPAMERNAVCPHCQKSMHLLLSPVEAQLMAEEGWVLSCPACAAVYVVPREE
jgi:predicted RNA-binding Zn-ribbon protein involved in translation (DUF1610 family)